MSETAAMVFIGVTVLVLVLVTVGGLYYLSDVLSGEDEHDDHGNGGAAH